MQKVKFCINLLLTVGTGGANSNISVDVQCNNSLINLTMNFLGEKLSATRQEYHWLEYECFLPNDNATVVKAKIPNPEGYVLVLSNYTQPVEDAPLPDGTVCTVRGCFYQTGSSIYRFIVPNNCTVGEFKACYEELSTYQHDCLLPNTIAKGNS